MFTWDMPKKLLNKYAPNEWCDSNGVSNDEWGFLHEIGHNFQLSAWKLDGCGEVTFKLTLCRKNVRDDVYIMYMCIIMSCQQ